MKKKSILALMLIALPLAGCKNSPGLQEYLQLFTFNCYANGGAFTEAFKTEKENQFKGEAFSANINLNYYTGGLAIMPEPSEMVAPEGKVFAGWYFDAACSPDKILSVYSMHKIVNEFKGYTEEDNVPKTRDVYAKWINKGTVDVCVELNDTYRVNTKNSYSEHFQINAKFKETYKAANPTTCGNENFVLNYDKEQLLLDGIQDNPLLPGTDDVEVGDERYLFHGGSVVNDDYTGKYNSYDPQEKSQDLLMTQAVIDGLKDSEGNDKQQVLILSPSYHLKPYVTFVFGASDFNIDTTNMDIPGLFSEEAMARAKATAIFDTNNSSYQHELRFQCALADITEEELVRLTPTKDDVVLADGYNAEKWASYELPKWEITECDVVDGKTTENRFDFTVENVRAKALKFCGTTFQLYLASPYPEELYH